jgi:hypothetical protein
LKLEEGEAATGIVKARQVSPALEEFLMFNEAGKDSIEICSCIHNVDLMQQAFLAKLESHRTEAILRLC